MFQFAEIHRWQKHNMDFSSPHATYAACFILLDSISVMLDEKYNYEPHYYVIFSLLLLLPTSEVQVFFLALCSQISSI